MAETGDRGEGKGTREREKGICLEREAKGHLCRERRQMWHIGN